jgi:hypothetical protein
VKKNPPDPFPRLPEPRRRQQGKRKRQAEKRKKYRKPPCRPKDRRAGQKICLKDLWRKNGKK